MALMLLCVVTGSWAAQKDYLCFTANTDSSKVIFKEDYFSDGEYSMDDGLTWKKFTGRDTFDLSHKGDKVLLRSNCDVDACESRYYSRYSGKKNLFSMEGSISASGNIMSLVDSARFEADTSVPQKVFADLFSGCKALTSAPALPATTLADYCYGRMFEGCSNLHYVKVAFVIWTDYGFEEGGCCGHKWRVWYDYTSYWLAGVSDTGTFVCPRDLELERGASYIPEGWNVVYDDEEGVIDGGETTDEEVVVSDTSSVVSLVTVRLVNDTIYVTNPSAPVMFVDPVSGLEVNMGMDSIVTIPVEDPFAEYKVIVGGEVYLLNNDNGVEDALSVHFDAWTDQGVLYIRDARSSVEIYSQVGSLVRRLENASSLLTVPLPSGFYIVRVGNDCLKIVL